MIIIMLLIWPVQCIATTLIENDGWLTLLVLGPVPAAVTGLMRELWDSTLLRPSTSCLQEKFEATAALPVQRAAPVTVHMSLRRPFTEGVLVRFRAVPLSMCCQIISPKVNTPLWSNYMLHLPHSHLNAWQLLDRESRHTCSQTKVISLILENKQNIIHAVKTTKHKGSHTLGFRPWNR